MVGSGKPIQVPLETLKALPVVLVPETSGFVVATGALVTADVEAVNTVERPTEF